MLSGRVHPVLTRDSATKRMPAPAETPATATPATASPATAVRKATAGTPMTRWMTAIGGRPTTVRTSGTKETPATLGMPAVFAEICKKTRQNGEKLVKKTMLKSKVPFFVR